MSWFNKNCYSCDRMESDLEKLRSEFSSLLKMNQQQKKEIHGLTFYNSRLDGIINLRDQAISNLNNRIDSMYEHKNNIIKDLKLENNNLLDQLIDIKRKLLEK